jgi:uncharacterized membrane protein YGL010W
MDPMRCAMAQNGTRGVVLFLWMFKNEHIMGIAENLALYCLNHTSPVNRAIHFVFVPLLVWSAAAIVKLNVALACWALTSVLWVSMDAAVGLSAAAVYLLLIIHGQTFEQIGVAAALHAASWFLQVGVGHGVFERNRPAFSEPLSFIVTAPLFVWIDVLFTLGLRRDLRHSVKEILNEDRYSLARI